MPTENNEMINNAVSETVAEVAKEEIKKASFADEHPYLTTFGVFAGAGAAMAGGMYAVDAIVALGKKAWNGLCNWNHDRKAKKAAKKNVVVDAKPEDRNPEA